MEPHQGFTSGKDCSTRCPRPSLVSARSQVALATVACTCTTVVVSVRILDRNPSYFVPIVNHNNYQPPVLVRNSLRLLTLRNSLPPLGVRSTVRVRLLVFTTLDNNNPNQLRTSRTSMGNNMTYSNVAVQVCQGTHLQNCIWV